MSKDSKNLLKGHLDKYTIHMMWRSRLPSVEYWYSKASISL